ncbi:hypothetical protein F4861DRAFT_541768 [Xylaria intraflava]|nr:hypothetical protein F4861DRAFT_541768 [Xylaria intraflava]
MAGSHCVSLASLVPNIHQSHQDAERTYQVQESDYDVRDDEALDLEGQGQPSLAVGGQGPYLHPQAAAHALFEKIVSGDDGVADVQRWLEDCKRHVITPWFVVTFRTLVDARLVASRSESEGAAVGVGITAPVSAVLGDPTGVSDVAGEAAREFRNEVRGDVTTPSERVYAIS